MRHGLKHDRFIVQSVVPHRSVTLGYQGVEQPTLGT
jgi:hypothetical protein